MKIIKEFLIWELKVTTNDTLTVLLASSGLEEKSVISLDDGTLREFKIPKTVDLVDRVLTCAFVARRLHLVHSEYGTSQTDQSSVTKNDLEIDKISKTEMTIFGHGMIPPAKLTRTVFLMELSTFKNWDGFSALPDYKFFLPLYEVEYERCRLLTADTVFQVTLELKQLDK